MNQYMLIYRAPGLHREVAEQLQKHVHGCLTTAILNYCLFVGFESETPMKVLKGELKAEQSDFILIQIENPEQLHLDFRNDLVAETIFHPFDPESECKSDHERIEKIENIDSEIDRILDKINKRGIDSLSNDELAILQKKSS